MGWTEIALTVAAKDLETATAVATAVSSDGLYIEDYSDLGELSRMARYDDIDESLLQKDREHAIIHLYLSAAEARQAAAFLGGRFRALGIGFSLRTAGVREEDWAENWKQYYHTLRVGERLVIRPSWEDYRPEAEDAVVTLDPGMSFGTGEHETTRLCLELLERKIAPGDAVLDVGTGSGILAIAAAKLGAGRVTAVDIDAKAAGIARENAGENDIFPPRMTVLAGDIAESAVSDAVGTGFDLIMANIVADVIISAAGRLFGKLKKGGLLIAGGIIENRIADTGRALAAAGFRVAEAQRRNDWAAMLAEK